ncbi:immunoglobulin-like domain-containing protein [Ornithinibacillus sp. 179-J 7C1 HS]|uniref:immunoglobulin-like domain-containing protein n=1 Tax=Ornithinibacillus sp. 179-J 7C1 HS TaxID=3142384 RepID=UPI0039A2B13D
MKRVILTGLFFVLCLAGCQQSSFLIEEDITEIEVVNWETEVLEMTITDQDFIQKLTEELSNADSVSTAKMDFIGRDYKLFLKSGEEVVYQLGYNKEPMNMGVQGRYWDYGEELLYDVLLRLPLGSEYGELSNLYQDDKTSIEITTDTGEYLLSTTEEIILSLENNGTTDINFGTYHYLEKFVGNRWQPIPYKDDIAFPDIGLVLHQGGVEEQELSIDSIDEKLTAGTYRIVKAFYQNGEENILAAEFKLK